MHEQSLITTLMTRINSVAKSENATAVTKVRVKLGALSHFSSEHFREHFEHASKHTLAENAQLEIIEDSNTNAPDAQDVTLLSVDVAE